MPLFPCRQCGRTITDTSESCPDCGIKAPFQCAECRRPIGAYTVNVRRSVRYPYGGTNADGKPVCHDHRPTRCDGCKEIFEQQVIRRRVVGKREDKVLRHGMAPRVEEAFGAFCPACDRRQRKSKGHGQVRESRPPVQVALFLGGGVLALIVLIALILIFR